MRRRGVTAGFSLLELVVAGGILSLLLVVAFARWQGHIAQQRLRYGIAQVATDLREAQERAKAERIPYAVTFAASASGYTIASGDGRFVENASLPSGVVAASDVGVMFSAFGIPDAGRTITIQNSSGTTSATVNVSGGITYQEP